MSEDTPTATSESQPDAIELSPITVRLPPSPGEDIPPASFPGKPSADDTGQPATPQTVPPPGVPPPEKAEKAQTTGTMSLVHPARTSNGTGTVGVVLEPARRQNGGGDDDADDEMDGINLSPEGLAPLLSQNQYTVRKMAAQALMDVALMMANISQLRTLITAGPDMEYYYAMLVMVSFSLIAQVLFAVIIFIVWMRETEDNYREEFMNTIITVAAKKDNAGAKSCRETMLRERQKKVEKFERHQTTNRLNYCTIVLVFIITVTNMFITGFGIKLEPSSNGTGVVVAG